MSLYKLLENLAKNPFEDNKSIENYFAKKVTNAANRDVLIRSEIAQKEGVDVNLLACETKVACWE